MLLRTPCTPRIASIHTHRIAWRRIPLRCYTPAPSDDPPWFQQLRTELLQRDVTHMPEHITYPHEHKLSQTLTGFLPRAWCSPPNMRVRVMPFGHHLIWFNPAVLTPELLPDGTDASQSPGGPWVRRMWAGGAIQLKPADYFDSSRGCTMDTAMVGTEHIKHVRLHGEGDAAKIFVTIERRFARLDSVESAYKAKHGKNSLGRRGGTQKIRTYLEQQLRTGNDDGWGDALLKEERNLVFFKERTAAELDAVRAGQMATVKYLDPPGKPDFSHSLTPNRALLFRFSALTFNAHLIHLDPNYARNVEGHRNLLVHGPLSLILMLETIYHHVHTQTEGKQVLQSIEYRNLAPLYCDEEMRICCLEKKKLENGSVYDVWIEGPTGGVAVKGTVRTTVKPIAPAQAPTVVSTNEPKAEGRSFRRPEHPALRYKMIKALEQAKKMAEGSKDSTQDHVASRDEQLSQDSPSPPSQSQGEIPNQSTPSETTSQPPSREVTSTPAHKTGRAYRRNRATNTAAYNFITLPPSEPPSARLVDSYKPVKPTLSVRSKELLRRARRHAPAEISLEPIPLVRRFDARPYTPDPVRTASRHSRFLREGVRKMDKLSVRYVAEFPERATGGRTLVFRYIQK